MSPNPATYTPRRPWEDRWNQPTEPQLLEPIGEQHHKYFAHLMQLLDQFEGVRRTVVWYGRSWRWTIQYEVYDAEGRSLGVLAYIIPRPESPQICISLTEAQVAKLPMRRLNRYIRDGIQAAKAAVTTHWATWSPTAMTEAEQLHDLLKRKHKFLTAPGDPDSNGSPSG